MSGHCQNGQTTSHNCQNRPYAGSHTVVAAIPKINSRNEKVPRVAAIPQIESRNEKVPLPTLPSSQQPVTRGLTLASKFDPGENYPISCTAQSFCFKLWHPGSSIFSSVYFFHLEGKVKLQEGVLLDLSLKKTEETDFGQFCSSYVFKWHYYIIRSNLVAFIILLGAIM